eukprot:CAMPEP_0171665086 /NCGR_PEP_ID=MMETSP0990-20121206/47234_1 /TAXON_ID=483369 /ORGANISM="non described non described, Strain CCMP2098" /LENGTH=83 /DNA_ID=CAMNT_0012248217 /DNA_START=231 /DNA_END=482 /DNA_ORIENTATION=+
MKRKRLWYARLAWGRNVTLMARGARKFASLRFFRFDTMSTSPSTISSPLPLLLACSPPRGSADGARHPTRDLREHGGGFPVEV